MTKHQVIKLYNTLSRATEEFTPLTPGRVRIYCCGPTVYNFQHIGNLRTYLFEDILVRTLRHAGYQVEHVMNITDVGHLVSDSDSGEDKMLVAARREKKTSREIADYYTGIFFDDCAKLHITRPSIVCKATDHIQEMINLIQQLERQGYTYFENGNVYFDISKDPGYGKLARLNLHALEAGSRIEIDKHKRNPLDFVLWFTKSKFEGQEMQWDSPWGRGYPGWHIECSAMSIKYLGDQFDIHCGGIDHVPVHHTNEIAQSECATGKPWVKVWMHGEFLVNENREKMAKSTGGFITMKTVEEKGFEPVVYRFLCLSAHYRQQLSFSWDALAGAAQSWEKLKRAIITFKAQGEPSAADREAVTNHPKAVGLHDQFFGAFANDLNAPQALAAVWSVLSEKELSAMQKLALLYECDSILGLGLSELKEQVFDIPSEVLQLAHDRDAARKAKNFARADELRKELLSRGFTVEDSPKGPLVRPAIAQIK